MANGNIDKMRETLENVNNILKRQNGNDKEIVDEILKNLKEFHKLYQKNSDYDNLKDTFNECLTLLSETKVSLGGREKQIMTYITQADGKGRKFLKYKQLVNCEPKSYKGNEVQQILRYISTQLYFRWKYSSIKQGDLVEVQCMIVQNSNVLFIAISPAKKAIFDAIQKDIQEFPLETMITTIYKHENPDDKYKIEDISKDFCEKLRKKIDDNDSTITALIESFNKFVQVLKVDEMKKIPPGIFIVELPNEKDHAEMHLCKVASEVIKHNPNAKFSIFGKKRPCVTCYVEMDELRKTLSNRNNLVFEEKFGTIFLDCIKDGRNDSSYGQFFKTVLSTLLNGECHVTVYPKRFGVSVEIDRTSSYAPFTQSQDSQDDDTTYNNNNNETQTTRKRSLPMERESPKKQH